ncbi:hypothetical protein BH11MYX2_BH11MYX2_18270 [soil metagenome]
MAVIDSKWAVPDSYDVTERVIALPPPRGQSPTSPMLAISSVRALEDQAAGNDEWAARTLSHGLVPALVQHKAPATDVTAVLGHAAALAVRAKSHVALEAVFRIAAKHGYSATVAQLSQFEPPVFTHKGTTAPASEAAAEEKPKKKAAAKRGKKGAQPER